MEAGWSQDLQGESATGRIKRADGLSFSTKASKLETWEETVLQFEFKGRGTLMSQLKGSQAGEIPPVQPLCCV